MFNITNIIGAVHKVRHAIFGQFLPPPLSHFVTHPGTKTGQKPIVQILSQLFAGVFVREVLSEGLLIVWKVLSGVVFVHSPFCQNTCYNRKLNITLNFMFHMYDKKSISVTSHALYPHPLSQTVTPSRTPPPSSVTYFVDGPIQHPSPYG